MKKHTKTTKMESAKKQVVKTQVNREKQKVKGEIQELAERLSGAARERAGKRQPAMAVTNDGFFVGIDLGDKESNYCFLNAEASIVAEGKLATTQAELSALFSSIPKCRIAVEVGTHSAWGSALLESHGHEVFVANPRKMRDLTAFPKDSHSIRTNSD